MATMKLAFFGDVVGKPGERAFARGAQHVREALGASVVIVNAENRVNGSGLHPEGYKAMRRAGADALTLGDHCFRDGRVIPMLEDPAKPVARPANFPAAATGMTRTVINPEGLPRIHVVTVLGRMFMPIMADCPIAALDRELAHAEEGDLAIVEVHAEATSEKIAIAHHCAERWAGLVVGVFGTHTHVQTADARIVGGQLGAITDTGFCGGHGGVIGRKSGPAIQRLRTQQAVQLPVCEDDCWADACVLQIDTRARRATGIEAISIEATDE